MTLPTPLRVARAVALFQGWAAGLGVVVMLAVAVVAAGGLRNGAFVALALLFLAGDVLAVSVAVVLAARRLAEGAAWARLLLDVFEGVTIAVGLLGALMGTGILGLCAVVLGVTVIVCLHAPSSASVFAGQPIVPWERAPRVPEAPPFPVPSLPRPPRSGMGMARPLSAAPPPAAPARRPVTPPASQPPAAGSGARRYSWEGSTATPLLPPDRVARPAGLPSASERTIPPIEALPPVAPPAEEPLLPLLLTPPVVPPPEEPPARPFVVPPLERLTDLTRHSVPPPPDPPAEAAIRPFVVPPPETPASATGEDVEGAGSVEEGAGAARERAAAEEQATGAADAATAAVEGSPGLTAERPGHAGAELPGAEPEPSVELTGTPATAEPPAELTGTPATAEPPAELTGTPATAEPPAELTGTPATAEPPAQPAAEPPAQPGAPPAASATLASARPPAGPWGDVGRPPHAPWQDTTRPTAAPWGDAGRPPHAPWRDATRPPAWQPRALPPPVPVATTTPAEPRRGVVTVFERRLRSSARPARTAPPGLPPAPSWAWRRIVIAASLLGAVGGGTLSAIELIAGGGIHPPATGEAPFQTPPRSGAIPGGTRPAPAGPRSEPAAAGGVAAVTLTPEGACSAGAACTVTVRVDLQPHPDEIVAWTLVVADRCSTQHTEIPVTGVSAPGPYRYVVSTNQLTIPAWRDPQILAVTTSPARASSQAVVLDGATGC